MAMRGLVDRLYQRFNNQRPQDQTVTVWFSLPEYDAVGFPITALKTLAGRLVEVGTDFIQIEVNVPNTAINQEFVVPLSSIVLVLLA